jgi:hypothetical protein
LSGDFYGYLHYENRDFYQLVQMNIVASTSTSNPHIQNQVLIAPTVSLFLGSSWDTSSIISTRFAQRVFYLNPGFALSSNDSDNIAVIGDWRLGYLSGVWYSRTYGRIGTFELQKGVIPSVPSQMHLVANSSGEFKGPIDGPSSLRNRWWIQLNAFGQVTRPRQSTMSLLGQYRLQDGRGVITSFDAGSLDLNSGQLNFLIRNNSGDRLVTGNFITEQTLGLLWPVGPGFAAPMSNHSSFTYLKIAGSGGK